MGSDCKWAGGGVSVFKESDGEIARSRPAGQRVPGAFWALPSHLAILLGQRHGLGVLAWPEGFREGCYHLPIEAWRNRHGSNYCQGWIGGDLHWRDSHLDIHLQRGPIWQGK